MSIARDSQFSEWAKLVHDEQLSIEVEGLKKSWNNLDVYRRQREALARRTYDLTQFIVSQAFEDEIAPKDILYKNGKPVLMYPENLTEWFKQKYAEAYYSDFPQGFHDWIASLGWKLEEITDIHVHNETVRDFEAEKNSFEQWQRWKYGKHVDVTIDRDTKEKYSARFIRLDNGDWQLKEYHDVTPFPGKQG